MPVPLPQTLNYLIAKVGHEHRSRAGHLLAEFGLHPGQEMLLVQLWQEDGLTQSELADRLGGQLPTVTRMLQRLERRGLIVRQTCDQDARVSRAYLTDEGRAIRQVVELAWERFEEQVLNEFSIEEKIVLKRLLIQIRQNLKVQL